MMSTIVDRFIRYCSVGSQSDPFHEDAVPSSPAQLDFAKLLADELLSLGVSDASVSEHAYVTGHVPASPGAEALPTLGLIAHIDTSPDAPASPVTPRVVRYEGGDLVLGGTKEAEVSITQADTPCLAGFVGQDLVVTDGTTLLGADDKAGIAEIMTLVERLQHDPSLPHPRLALCFCPDEEIGHGCSLLDLPSWGASFGYTVDGGAIGEIQYECFNAAEAVVTFEGREIHPGSAKDIMVNALHLFEEFDLALPAWQRPEHTDGYDGFYHLHSVSGTTSHATARYIIRDHDRARFEDKKQLMLDVAGLMNTHLKAERVRVALSDQYANMAEPLAPHMHLIERAKESFRACGIEPIVEPIRGGTDGAQLSYRGLPCPNLSTGGFNFHSVREFIPVRSLEQMVEVLLTLVFQYAQEVR